MGSQDQQHILQELEDLIFKQKKTVSCNYTCKHFKIPIPKAAELLQEFVSKHKKDKLEIEYFLSGHDNDDSEQIKLQRYAIVDAEELESQKKLFKNLECGIYSICTVGNYQPFCNFEEFISAPSVENFKELQKLTYIDNPHINIRLPLRGSASKINQNQSSFTKIETKPEPKSKPEPMEIESSTVSSSKKPSSSTKIEAKPKQEPMEVESKIVSSPKRRSSSKGDETSKRFKRVQILDSSEDEDEKDNIKEMKENHKVEEYEFTVTKLVAKDEAPKPAPKDISSVENKNSNNATQKGKANNAKKLKASENQRSITSFFTKAPPKK